MLVFKIINIFTSISDIDECKINKGGCDSNAVCANTQGSYLCKCKNGYTGDGKTCAGMLTLCISFLLLLYKYLLFLFV